VFLVFARVADAAHVKRGPQRGNDNISVGTAAKLGSDRS
jgi:hypothetical protein